MTNWHQETNADVLRELAADLPTGLTDDQVKLRTSIIRVTSNSAHLLTALEDTIFVEYFKNDYSATDYSEYRSIVIQKMTDRK